MHIGDTVRKLRQDRKMKLIELAQQSGVQIATLSRIEHNKMTGTLESHMAIARALGVDVTELYSDIIKEDKAVEVKPAGQKQDVFVHSRKASFEILTNDVMKKKMMPVLHAIEPGGASADEQGPVGSERFIYVLEGKVNARIGDETYPLSKGHSVYFEGSLEHRLENAGKAAAKILVIATPPTF